MQLGDGSSTCPGETDYKVDVLPRCGITLVTCSTGDRVYYSKRCVPPCPAPESKLMGGTPNQRDTDTDIGHKRVLMHMKTVRILKRDTLFRMHWRCE